jgi:acetyltransferase-like isoleucine patch superfamily enzyme
LPKKFQYFSKTSVIRPGAYIVGCSKIRIGSRVIIRPGCMFFGESETLQTSITIEEDVMLGAGVHIYINNHKFDSMDLPIIDQGYYPDTSVVLKNGCWIGANAIILPGVEVGKNAVIGAGSVVTKSIPDGALAVGSPAKIIRYISSDKSR